MASSVAAKAAKGVITGPGPQAATATLTTPAEAALRMHKKKKLLKLLQLPVLKLKTMQ
jgi:hypothetical protein